LHGAVGLLAKGGMAVEAVPTRGAGTAGQIARDAVEHGADLILVAGGDGTINEVVNGMVHSEVPLGILPAGTANVLANELRIGKTMEQAAASLASCTPRRVALGLISTDTVETPRHFLLMAGAGLDAEIIYDLNLGLKEKLGKAAYWIGGFRKIGQSLPAFCVNVEGKVFRAGFALVSRVRNYGGDLEIAPTISLLEDEFEVVLFEGENSFRYLKYMLGAVIRRLEGMRGVTILRARTVSFSAPDDPRIYVQVDGEFAGSLPARVALIPQALTLLMPPGFPDQPSARPEDAQWTTSRTR
jgi:diacylglycerol kinase (ATP)